VPAGFICRDDVSENGPGIAPDLLPEIFEPFSCGAKSEQAGAIISTWSRQDLVSITAAQLNLKLNNSINILTVATQKLVPA
jgi:C4-dicarboxylate-specific signal transduction histidine kinase